MPYSACGNSYNTQQDSPNLFYTDWWDVPGTIYSLRESSFLNCPCSECLPCVVGGSDASVLVYKDSRSTFLGSKTWCGSDTSFDNGNICVTSLALDCSGTGPSARWRVYTGLVCSTYNDVYVNSSSGWDGYCGNTSSVPVQTFGRAYSLLNSNGTIHVLNGGADFSSETVTFGIGFQLTIADGNYFYMPKLT